MITVETIYRARISFDADADTQQAIEDRAFSWGEGLEVEHFRGVPACYPSIEAEGYTENIVAKWAEKVERYIKRRKHAQLVT